MKVILLWALLMIAGCALKAQSTPEEKLMQTLYAITNLYVDSISKEAYINHTIAEMMRKLDPFSEYLPPVQLQGNEQVLGGMTNFAGIGVEGTWKNGHFYVTFVERNGNAWKQGIRAGDEVVSVDGKTLGQLQDGQIFIERRRGKRGYFASKAG